MRVILLMVSSVDGKSTKNNKSLKEWTSKEDQEYFLKTSRSNNLIVMGSKTYESSQSKIKPYPNRLKIVLTRNPKKYVKNFVPGQLEFINDSPLELVRKLEKKGYKQMLLIGGSTLNTEFMKSNLVTDLWLTIEPVIFGKGKSLVGEEDLDIKLNLKSLEKLNKQGTLLLKYSL